MLLERLLFAGSAIAGLICFAFIATHRSPDLESDLVASSIEQDLGNVQRGSTAEASFTLTARTNLKIIRVVTSCGCTAALLDRTDVARGQTAAMRLHWTIPHQGDTFSTSAAILYQRLEPTSGVQPIRHVIVHLNATADHVESATAAQ